MICKLNEDGTRESDFINLKPEKINYESELTKYKDSYLFEIIINNINSAKLNRNDTILINYPKYPQIIKDDNLNLLYQIGKYVLAHKKEFEILGYKIKHQEYKPTQLFNEIQISQISLFN